MSWRIRAHIRSHIVGYVALFFALSGSAVAVSLPGKNLVNSKDVINKSLKSKDYKNDNIKSIDVKDGSLAGVDVLSDSLTGDDLSNDSIKSIDVEDASLAGVDVLSDSLTGDDLSIDVTVRSADGTGPTQVSCLSGEVAVGGGGHATLGDAHLRSSRPNPQSGTPTGWEADFRLNKGPVEGQPDPGTVYAVCAEL
jgi:hypothetical protein